MSIGRLLRATLNAHSTNLSLVRGMNTSSFLANRRTARREESPEAGCGKMEIYPGTALKITKCTRRHTERRSATSIIRLIASVT